MTKELWNMPRTENGNKYALIAAICYVVYALFSIIFSSMVSNDLGISVSFLDVVYCILTIGLAAALILRNQKIVAAVSAAYSLLSILFIIFPSVLSILFVNPVECAAYIAVTVCIVLALKGYPIMKKIWFVPAAVMLLEIFFDGGWYNIIGVILKVAALFFVGMWINENIAPEKAASASTYSGVNLQGANADPTMSSVIGGADKIKAYKELLESGAITQEEFDDKKKQLLGL